MNLQINSEGLELTDKMHRQINDKLTQKIDKLLIHFSEEVKTANLIIKREKLGDYTLKFEMYLPGKESIIAKHSHGIFISALVGIREQAERQIEKYKQELAGHNLA